MAMSNPSAFQYTPNYDFGSNQQPGTTTSKDLAQMLQMFLQQKQGGMTQHIPGGMSIDGYTIEDLLREYSKNHRPNADQFNHHHEGGL